ncbi:hypothetical protein OUZ56_005528 [Daphnia magna]|uniref:Uncharacterized protein n=1 Tax=Daphnia magna TaxID=35525 RepID=A0ABQ9YT85_9CRUS|nr:hypothetical protein OUZ56_005528 [Daphnia magna]
MYRGHRINRNPSSHRQNGAFSIALTCNAIDLSRAIDGWLSSIVLELFSHLFLGIEMVMWGNLAGQFRLDLSDAVQLALCLLVDLPLRHAIRRTPHTMAVLDWHYMAEKCSAYLPAFPPCLMIATFLACRGIPHVTSCNFSKAIKTALAMTLTGVAYITFIVFH